MDTLKAIEKLAGKARSEEVAGFDVSGEVLLRIKSGQPEAVNFLLFDLFAGISAIAASVVAFFSVHAWQYIANPIVDFFAPLQEVPLW